MKKSIFFIVFISFSASMLGQVYEVGISLGGTNYVGDIGRTNYIYPNKPAGAVFFKYNWNPRIALRATYSYLPIQGDNKNADRDLPLSNGIDISNFSFENTINELALGMEFNFYEYDLSSSDKTWTPYLLIELVAFNYKTVVSEPTPNVYNYGNKTSYSLPVSLGYKSKLFGNLAFAVEAKFRYTFEDDLDYSTSSIPSLNFGGTGNDWYMFTGVSLMYTFGRPACYTQGL
jgi:hypothetical protein